MFRLIVVKSQQSREGVLDLILYISLNNNNKKYNNRNPKIVKSLSRPFTKINSLNFFLRKPCTKKYFSNLRFFMEPDGPYQIQQGFCHEINNLKRKF